MGGKNKKNRRGPKNTKIDIFSTSNNTSDTTPISLEDGIQVSNEPSGERETAHETTSPAPETSTKPDLDLAVPVFSPEIATTTLVPDAVNEATSELVRDPDAAKHDSVTLPEQAIPDVESSSTNDAGVESLPQEESTESNDTTTRDELVESPSAPGNAAEHESQPMITLDAQPAEPPTSEAAEALEHELEHTSSAEPTEYSKSGHSDPVIDAEVSDEPDQVVEEVSDGPIEAVPALEQTETVPVLSESSLTLPPEDIRSVDSDISLVESGANVVIGEDAAPNEHLISDEQSLMTEEESKLDDSGSCPTVGDKDLCDIVVPEGEAQLEPDVDTVADDSLEESIINVSATTLEKGIIDSTNMEAEKVVSNESLASEGTDIIEDGKQSNDVLDDDVEGNAEEGEIAAESIMEAPLTAQSEAARTEVTSEADQDPNVIDTKDETESESIPQPTSDAAVDVQTSEIPVNDGDRSVPCEEATESAVDPVPASDSIPKEVDEQVEDLTSAVADSAGVNSLTAEVSKEPDRVDESVCMEAEENTVATELQPPPPDGEATGESAAIEAPSTETHPAEAPSAEVPPAEAPPVEAPSAEAPPAEASSAEASSAEAPSAEAPSAEAPPAEAPPSEGQVVEAPPIETPTVEAPPVEAPPAEAPSVEAPPVEAPPVEAPLAEAPPAGETSIDSQPVEVASTDAAANGVQGEASASLEPVAVTAAAVAAGATAAVLVSGEKKAKSKSRAVSPGHQNSQKGHIDRHKGEGKSLSNAYAHSIDKAKHERELRHSTPEYKEKVRRRKERREPEEHKDREERYKEKTERKTKDEKPEISKSRSKDSTAPSESKVKEAGDKDERRHRKRRESPGSSDGSVKSSPGVRRPQLFKMGESDTGGRLLMINMAKAGGEESPKDHKKHSRHHHHHHHGESGSSSKQSSKKKEDSAPPIVKIARAFGLASA